MVVRVFQGTVHGAYGPLNLLGPQMSGNLTYSISKHILLDTMGLIPSESQIIYKNSCIEF